MLWLKSFHIIFMVAWFAGLFYLPRLFVYHSMLSEGESGGARFKLMERRLYFGIMTPAAVLTVGSGVWLWLGYGLGAGRGWLYAKLGLVLVLLAYHFLCGKYWFDFLHDRNRHGHVFYRWLNEVPTLLLVGIVLLAVVRPF